MTELVPNATIERLRVEAAKQLADLENSKPTSSQLNMIVQELQKCSDISTIALKVGLEESRVLDLVAGLGTWLTHSNKTAPKAIIETSDEALMDVLFLGPWSHQIPETKRKRGRPKRQPITEYKVTVPPGFDGASFYKRDVSKALAAIIVSPPNEETLTRYLVRTYNVRSSSLTYPIVSGVWYMAYANRLDKIDKVNAKDPIFHLQAVAAYDLLDIARQDAVDAIKVLLEAEATDFQTILDAIVKCKWIAERDLTVLEDKVEVAMKRPAALKTLETELAYFKSRVKNSPNTYLPKEIRDLNVGQVRRISEAAGIQADGLASSEESKIRMKLKSLGLTSDLDILVPEGIRAAEIGQLDAFWDVMASRAEGDNSWGQALQEIFLEKV